MQLPVSAVRQHEISEEMWAHLQTINGIDYIQVHPTFLYEGCWNLMVLIILFLIRKKMKFNGELFLFYIAGYASGRFWIESLRTDQLLIMHTGIPVSMVVSAVAFAGAVVIIKEILNFLYVALSKNKQHNIKCGPCGRLFYVQNGR